MRKLEAKFSSMVSTFLGNWFFFSFFITFFFGLFVGGFWTKVLSCLIYDVLFTIPVWLKSGAHGFAFYAIFCGFILLFFIPIYCFVVEKRECIWGGIWMRNIFLVFVFYQGKKKKKTVLYFVLYVCCVVLLSVWVVYFWVLFCSLLLLC